MAETMFKIGEIAKRSGFSIQTLRYYEKEQLIRPCARSESGYRLYSESIFSLLEYIQRLKKMGFSLPDIRELNEMCESKSASTKCVKAKAELKLIQINEKLDVLHSVKGRLEKVIALCPGDDSSIQQCPIIHPLDS